MLEHEEKEYDEHVWLSLRNAEKLCDAIVDSLCDIDSEIRMFIVQMHSL